jgi:membrane protease YdiL (CAAX protease family)
VTAELSNDRWQRSNWSIEPTSKPDRAPTFEILIVAVLFGWNLVANLLVPDLGAVPVSVSGMIAALLLARRAGANWSQLGVDRGSLSSGLRLGGIAFLLVTSAVVIAALIPALRDFLGDDRFVGVAVGEVLYETLIRIPIGTALGEELAFRGVLLGVLLAWFSPLRATLISSALFGLWHVLPGIEALETTTVTSLSSGLFGALSVAVQVIVTGAVGVAFAWLRFRSGSIAAPVLAHWAINGSAFMVGWLIVENGWA